MIVTRKETLSSKEVENFLSSTGAAPADNSSGYAMLASLAKQLESLNDIGVSSASAAATESDEMDEDLYLELRSKLSTMMGFLEENKTEVAKFFADKSELSAKMDKFNLDDLQKKTDELMAQIEKNKKRSLIQKIISIFTQIVTAIAAVVITAVTLGAGAAISAALVTVVTTVLLSVPVNPEGQTIMDITMDKMVESMVSSGMDEDTSKLLAALTAITMIVALSLVGTKGASGAARSMGFADTADSIGGLGYKIVTMNFFQSVSTVGLLPHIAMVMPGDEEKKEEAAKWLAVIEQILCLIGSMVSLHKMGSQSVRNTTNMPETQVARLQGYATSAQRVGMITSAVGGGAMGASQILSGITSNDIAQLLADIQMLNYNLSSNSAGAEDDKKTQAALIEAQAEMTRSYAQLSSANRALAEAMA